MSKTGEIPYSWEEIENQVREAILAQATILGMYGPQSERALVHAYLGVDFDAWDYQDMTEEQIASIDLSRHYVHRLARFAYHYAYQLDGMQIDTGEAWYETRGLLAGFPRTDWQGNLSPFHPIEDAPLRRMFETFFARWSLNVERGDMSVRQLSLLANMTVPAVRTSLSKEGYKLEKRSRKEEEDEFDTGFTLEAGGALRWLSQRRGYIPNRQAAGADDRTLVIPSILDTPDIPFPEAVKRIMEFLKVTPADISASTGRDEAWLRSLLAGQAATCDLSTLRSLAKALSAPEPTFVGMAVTHLLAQEGAA